jgi:hypothetical protein
MKTTSFTTIVKTLSALGIILSGLVAVQAFAMTPTLSLTSQGTNQILLSVYGDPYSTVILESQNGYNLQTIGTLGTTNSAGYYSTVLNTNSYSLYSGQQVFALVNNQQSTSTVWPYVSNYNYNNYTNYNYGSLSLSQTSITVSAGQSNSVSAYTGSGTLYISSNTNPTVATGTIYGSTINVTGSNQGSTTLTVCSNNGGCASLYITVSYSSYNNYTNYNYQNTYPYSSNCTYSTNCYNQSNQITFSQSNVTVLQGQNQQIQINSNIGNSYYPNTNYGNQYYISTFTSPNIINPSISGNNLNIVGLGAGSGSITVCSNNNYPYTATYNTNSYNSYGYPYGTSGTNCGTIYVTIAGNNQYYSNNINNWLNNFVTGNWF